MQQYDDSYASCYQSTDKNLRYRLFCIDPAGRMKNALKRCSSVVFFSATLSPVSYFKKIFGCENNAKQHVLPSPFPIENLKVCIAGNISTKYADRRSSKVELVDMIAALTGEKKGNYLIFFPSYEYMNMTTEVFIDKHPDIRVIVQDPNFSEEERSVFLNSFSAESEETLVGFAVMGGVFGEGIDLIGDRLCAAAIVGPGLPGLGPERELIKEYFARTQGKGFQFAYQYPGMGKVLQAAGRVIRSENDRGVVLLIDDRFAQYSYSSLFPETWKSEYVKNSVQLKGTLKKFWNT